MQTLQKCEKCKEEYWQEYGYGNQIKGILCNKCYEKWEKFFEKNHERIQREFPEHQNPTWLVFIGVDPIIPERVQFT